MKDTADTSCRKRVLALASVKLCSLQSCSSSSPPRISSITIYTCSYRQSEAERQLASEYYENAAVVLADLITVHLVQSDDVRMSLAHLQNRDFSCGDIPTGQGCRE